MFNFFKCASSANSYKSSATIKLRFLDTGGADIASLTGPKFQHLTDWEKAWGLSSASAEREETFEDLSGTRKQWDNFVKDIMDICHTHRQHLGFMPNFSDVRIDFTINTPFGRGIEKSFHSSNLATFEAELRTFLKQISDLHFGQEHNKANNADQNQNQGPSNKKRKC